jgi:hypothetical protein
MSLTHVDLTPPHRVADNAGKGLRLGEAEDCGDRRSG